VAPLSPRSSSPTTPDDIATVLSKARAPAHLSTRQALSYALYGDPDALADPALPGTGSALL